MAIEGLALQGKELKMLFRRIKVHIQNENWFAVFIDFLIVVVGVFLGIQIGEWNNERITHDRTMVLTERLAKDFGADIWIASGFLAYHKTVIENAKIVLKDLTNKKPVTDNELLVAAFRATQFNRFGETSTYKELLANGGYELIAKSELGKTASFFYESEQMNDIQLDGKSSDYRLLYRTVMPIDVQLQAAELCGDGDEVLFENILNDISLLSYDCKLTLSENQLSEAADILRSHPELSNVLRRRIANLSMQTYDLENMLKRAEPFRASFEDFKISAPATFYGIK